MLQINELVFKNVRINNKEDLQELIDLSLTNKYAHWIYFEEIVFFNDYYFTYNFSSHKDNIDNFKALIEFGDLFFDNRDLLIRFINTFAYLNRVKNSITINKTKIVQSIISDLQKADQYIHSESELLLITQLINLSKDEWFDINRKNIKLNMVNNILHVKCALFSARFDMFKIYRTDLNLFYKFLLVRTPKVFNELIQELKLKKLNKL